MPWPKGKNHSAETRDKMRRSHVGKTCGTPESRFWEKVTKVGGEECWLWSGAKDEDGYGKFFFRGKIERAHRVAYIMTVGPIGDLQVLHTCDTPACVRSDHLFLGTQGDNIADAWKKGRFKGTTGYRHSDKVRTKISKALMGKVKSCKAKDTCRVVKRAASPLSSEDVVRIKQLRTDGQTYRKLALEFCVSITTAFNVCNGRTWA